MAETAKQRLFNIRVVQQSTLIHKSFNSIASKFPISGENEQEQAMSKQTSNVGATQAL